MFQLAGGGLDVGFYLANTINDDLERVIEENRDQIIEGIKYRALVNTLLLIYVIYRRSHCKIPDYKSTTVQGNYKIDFLLKNQGI